MERSPRSPSGTGTGNTILALEVWDDGAGESLLVGGLFTSAGGLEANRVARWDGTTWFPLSGPSGNGVGETQFDGVHALEIWDSGGGEALLVGGEFTTAGGLPVRNLATWDGTDWSPATAEAGNGIEGTIHAVTTWDDGAGPAVFAAGSFTTAGATTVHNIARWDSASWSPLEGPVGNGTDNDIRALTVWDDGTREALYAGGAFNIAGGVPANGIARWDGVTWSALSGPMDNGMDGTVDALTVWDDGSGEALYVGDRFEEAGRETANRIARWDGDSWTTLSGPRDIGISGESYPEVHSLGGWTHPGGECLFSGGSFDLAGGLASASIARWSCGPHVFSDGFESGTTSLWSSTIP